MTIFYAVLAVVWAWSAFVYSRSASINLCTSVRWESLNGPRARSYRALARADRALSWASGAIAVAYLAMASGKALA